MVNEPETIELFPKSASIFSLQYAWYWLILTLSSMTLTAIFIIPEGVYPLTYLRAALGLVFLIFLPGFALVQLIFPLNQLIKGLTNSIDLIERLALSIGMSLVMVPIMGLILNYTVWGIRLFPTTFSLFVLTVFLSTIALIRMRQFSRQTTEKSDSL